MYNHDTELLFPPRVIGSLRELRGKPWAKLVDRVMAQGPREVERLAFVLMMVRLGGCASCQSDSFRAMQGCTQCAIQTVRRYRGHDDELIKLFETACSEVQRYLEKK